MTCAINRRLHVWGDPCIAWYEIKLRSWPLSLQKDSHCCNLLSLIEVRGGYGEQCLVTNLELCHSGLCQLVLLWWSGVFSDCTFLKSSTLEINSWVGLIPRSNLKHPKNGGFLRHLFSRNAFFVSLNTHLTLLTWLNRADLPVRLACWWWCVFKCCCV